MNVRTPSSQVTTIIFRF